MERTFAIALTLVTITGGGVLLAQAPRSADVQFKAAQYKEEVEGDLKGAIEEYKKIAQATDRALAARALLRLADCYQKLGDVEAQRIYERLVSEFSDQKEVAAVARARLGRTESAPRADGMSSRQVWTLSRGAVIYGNVSHDGRYVPYTHFGAGGDLFLHDLASGAHRRATAKKPGPRFEYAEFGGTFSPDDTQFAYAWFNGEHFEVRIVGLKTPGVDEPGVLFSNPEVPRIWPQDWSPDGTWLAVQLQRADKTAQIGLVAVQDGSLRVLKSVGWRGSSKLFFSPDGRHLAYDLPTTEAGDRRDVFVLAIDGSRELPAVVHPSHNVLMGWSPDGRRLLFASDRTGSVGLWSVAFVDGEPQGAPEQIKAGLPGTSMGLTRKGALYSLVHHSNFTGVIRSDVQVAAFDFANGQFASTPVMAIQAFVGANNFPAWSPDGKNLAFLSRRGWPSVAIGILSHDTGQLRELRPELNFYSGGPGARWSPDGLFLAIPATDSKGRQGIFRIDASTGEVTPIALSSRGPAGEAEFFTGPMWAPDGKRIYYTRVAGGGGSTVLVSRELSSGHETELTWRTGVVPVDLSPDGKYFAALDGRWFAGPPVAPGRTGTWNVWLIPAHGGEPIDLMRGQSHGAGVLMWAPDSRSIFVYSIKDKSTNDREVWRIPIDGTKPHTVALNVNFLGPHGNSDQQFHVHPDGKRVAFAAAQPAKPSEVWVLEDFLPSRARR